MFYFCFFIKSYNTHLKKRAAFARQINKEEELILKTALSRQDNTISCREKYRNIYLYYSILFLGYK
jgi:hypothetical protein